MTSETKTDLGLPWKFSDEGPEYSIWAADLELVANDAGYYPSAPSRDKAAYIVKAVNHHEALVAMLIEAAIQIEYMQGKFAATGTGEAVACRCRNLLASLE